MATVPTRRRTVMRDNFRGMKLKPINITQFTGEDISKYFAFKQDFIAYIHSRDDMHIEEKMVAPYLVRYKGRGQPSVLHTLLGPVIMFGEPRKHSLETFSAPVTNMSVTILATVTELEEKEQPHLPPSSELSPSELLSILWRYDLMARWASIRISSDQTSRTASTNNKRGTFSPSNLALEVPIPWIEGEPTLMDNREEVRRDALRD
jgi:hypothetical protein